MKILRKQRKFASYKEMCKALDIMPAPRGSQREVQREEIQKHYEMKVQKNKSIILNPLTEKGERIKNGQLVIIDGNEVDLCSKSLYCNTHINDYILYVALSKSNYINTKEGVVINCFKSMRLFKTLLLRGNINELSKYKAGSLNLVNEYVIRRLNAFVTYRLKKFEAEGLIETETYYQTMVGIEDKDGICDNGYASVEEVDMSVRNALEKLDLRTEYQAFENKYIREKFIKLRNEYFKSETGRILLAKRFVVRPKIENDNIKKYELSNKECQVILTSYYDIFREKLCYDLEHCREKNASVNARRKNANDWWHYRKEAQEIIQNYCAYMTSDKNNVFYSLDDLGDWEEQIKKLQEGRKQPFSELDYLYYDNQKFYDETDPFQKNEIDYYALSNITEEQLEKQREKDDWATEYFKEMYGSSESTN